MQGFGNFGDRARLLYALNPDLVSNGRPAHTGVEITQSCCLPIENANRIKEENRQTNPRKNKRAKVAKSTVLEAAAARATGKKFKRVS